MNINLIIIIAGFTLFLSSCSEEEKTYNYPQSPYIQSPSLEYLENSETGYPDTLKLSFEMFDKEGDLGIDGYDTEFPFHDFEPVFDSEDRWVTYGSQDVSPPFYIYLPYPAKSMISEIDNRPEFTCSHYMEANLDENYKTLLPDIRSAFSYPNDHTYDQITVDGTIFYKDSLYVVKNENRNNIFLEWYRLVDGKDELIDWKNIVSSYDCGINFDGRFQYIESLKIFQTSHPDGSPYKISKTSKYEYQLEYSMASIGFRTVLRKDPFKFKVTIKDRELNASNVLETDYMTLDELMVNN